MSYNIVRTPIEQDPNTDLTYLVSLSKFLPSYLKLTCFFCQVVQAIARSVIQHEAVILNKKTTHDNNNDQRPTPTTTTDSYKPHPHKHHSQQQQQQQQQQQSPSHSLDFAPSEVEGQIFFDGQPVALVPLVTPRPAYSLLLI